LTQEEINEHKRKVFEKDPEIKEILKDPVFRKLCKELQTNPKNPKCFELLKDPEIKRKMIKL